MGEGSAVEGEKEALPLDLFLKLEIIRGGDDDGVKETEINAQSLQMHHKALFDCVNESIEGLRDSGVGTGKVARVGRLRAFVPGSGVVPSRDEIIRMVKDGMSEGGGGGGGGGVGFAEDDDREWEIQINEEEKIIVEEIVDDMFSRLLDEAVGDGLKLMIN